MHTKKTSVPPPMLFSDVLINHDNCVEKTTHPPYAHKAYQSVVAICSKRPTLQQNGVLIIFSGQLYLADQYDWATNNIR